MFADITVPIIVLRREKRKKCFISRTYMRPAEGREGEDAHTQCERDLRGGGKRRAGADMKNPSRRRLRKGFPQKTTAVSDVARHLAGFQAGCADIETLWRAFYECAYTLNVWVPTTARTHMGVRDALAEAWALAADVTYRGHGYLLCLSSWVKSQLKLQLKNIIE